MEQETMETLTMDVCKAHVIEIGEVSDRPGTEQEGEAGTRYYLVDAKTWHEAEVYFDAVVGIGPTDCMHSHDCCGCRHHGKARFIVHPEGGFIVFQHSSINI